MSDNKKNNEVQSSNNNDELSKPKMKLDNKDEVMWATFCHLSALINLIVLIPFSNILGPLVIWLIKKNEMPLVDSEGKESINFQLSMTIYISISFFLSFVLIGLLFLIPLIISNVILVIIASIKTNKGEKFKYPLTIRFIK